MDEGRDGIAQVVERFAQRRTPLLIPAGTAARTAAVGAPAFDAVRAAPRGVFDNLRFEARGIFLEELAVVGQVGAGRIGLDGVILQRMQHPRERHLAIFVMVTVALAVGGDVHDLRFAAVGFEAADQALGESFAVVQQAFEGDGAGARAVVEEDIDGAAFLEADEIGTRSVDGGVGRIDPNRLSRGLRVFGG